MGVRQGILIGQIGANLLKFSRGELVIVNKYFLKVALPIVTDIRQCSDRKRGRGHIAPTGNPNRRI